MKMREGKEWGTRKHIRDVCCMVIKIPTHVNYFNDLVAAFGALTFGQQKIKRHKKLVRLSSFSRSNRQTFVNTVLYTSN